MLIRKLRKTQRKLLAAAVLMACLNPLSPITVSGAAREAQPWPEGLRESVNSYFQTLQVTEYRTRDSTLAEPPGVQPMTEFDRAGHKCHEVPGQVYRIYKIPNYFTEDTDGSFLVRSRFDLFFRQAESITQIFSEPWEQGSGGAFQVRFEKVDGKWESVEKRELLE
ncbi:MAG: hypothetical protein RRA15_03975 [bacterium]|nr:hypothetical protein [bacterium]MDT8365634.1 hypothetical protein [bacterium]